MPDDTRRPTTSLLYSVKRLELVIRARLDEMLRDSELTTLQYTALTVLARHDGITAAKLARDSFVSPQAMADMLKALGSRDMVTKSPNPRNGREVLVHLTPEGQALLLRFAEPAQALEIQMMAGFTAAQRETFRRALSAAWAALQD